MKMVLYILQGEGGEGVRENRIYSAYKYNIYIFYVDYRKRHVMLSTPQVIRVKFTSEISSC